MAASKKAIDNANRLKYIRALERFHKSIISFLSSNNDLSKESYIKKINNALKLLNRVEKVVLYKGELKDLEVFVEKMINYKVIDLKGGMVYVKSKNISTVPYIKK